MTGEDVNDLLLELKENAEVMIDLAYSSIIYDNRDIAEEVYELEEQSDELTDRLQRAVIEDSKKGLLSVDETLALLRLSVSMEEMCDSAMDIADIELRDLELHPIIKISIEESDEIFVRERVDESSAVSGKTIGELKLASELGAWVIAVKRRKRWYYNPGKFTHLMPGDTIFARTTREAKDHFIQVLMGESKKI